MSGRKQIPERIRFQLVARAAGRCQFPGCNKVLYEDELTKGPGNISNYAHIIPYRKDGPRGPETLHERPSNVDTLDNLMLLCWEHHKLVDTKPVPPEYSAKELRRIKKEHEDRIKTATSIQAERKAFVVNYTIPIAQGITAISVNEARLALFPDYYPAQSDVIDLSPSLPNVRLDTKRYQDAVEDLRCKYHDFILRRIRECESPCFAVFAIGPMPLLIQLGVHINDTPNTIVYQKQRDAGWGWDESAPERKYTISTPEVMGGKKAVLLITLTQGVNDLHIRQALGDEIAIWKISADYHGYDVISNRQHLIDFKKAARKVLDEILQHYPHGEEVHIFPIMPVSACVEFGRIRTAAHNPWVIYERRRDTDGFCRTISIN